ncbi:MAG TPA: TetR/AcrR family transcriptional regulator [Geodermatophilus sp.]|nr:TetR/AcrR family transcriptional regulator [Geodermatophilus sp.]
MKRSAAVSSAAQPLPDEDVPALEAVPGRPPGPPRQRDAERTRAEILDVATSEFADRGYAGARVDEIAAKTSTTKRMIYYYFGGKEQLYTAVLERSYSRIRGLEQELDVEHLDPVEAIRALAGLTFDHHEAHPDFIRLVSIENIHRAEHIARSERLSNLNTRALDVLGRILARGREAGVFRDDVEPLDVHQVISGFCIYRTANRYTWRALFGRDMLDPERRDQQRRMLGDLVVAYLTSR